MTGSGRQDRSRPYGGGSSAFRDAMLGMIDGATVVVADQEGRLGRVVAIDELEPGETGPATALVVFDRGGAVSYDAGRFNSRLRIVRLIR